MNSLLSVDQFDGFLSILVKNHMLNKLLLRYNLPSVNDFSITINLILDDVNSISNMRCFGNLVYVSLSNLDPHENPNSYGHKAITDNVSS